MWKLAALLAFLFVGEAVAMDDGIIIRPRTPMPLPTDDAKTVKRTLAVLVARCETKVKVADPEFAVNWDTSPVTFAYSRASSLDDFWTCIKGQR